MQNDVLAPIIIIGMHRSGTSMVTDILRQSGVFIGNNLDSNHEAHFFINLNNWLLTQAGASWENPEKFDDLLNTIEQKGRVTDFVRHTLASGLSTHYFGIRRYLQYRQNHGLRMPWAWKDPRNTFTLPVWFELFPDAKIIHIYRHGVDVAASLSKRAETETLAGTRYPFKLYYLQWLFLGEPLFLINRAYHPAVMRDINCAFNLWETYVARAQHHIQQAGQQGISICYEDALANPVDTVTSLIEFCELDVSSSHIEKIASTVKPARRFAYQSADELRQFADSVQQRLGLYGYDKGD